MKRLALFAAILMLTPGAGDPAPAADEPAPDAYWVYFGTYTGGKGGSKGIHRAKFDAKTGKLSDVAVAAEMGSPSFVTIHPNGKFLYAVGEGQGKDGGAVVAFSLDAKTGELTKLNEGKSGGPGPCHIVVSPKGTHAAVANYGGGSTALFTLGADGKLGDRVGFVQHQGNSVNPGRQKEPHAHCCAFNPTGEYVVTVDLGIDKVKVFKIDPVKGLVESPKSDMIAPPGSGPRHIALVRGGKFAYVCGELDSTVNVFEDHKVVQSLSTLPEPTPGNSTAECILSPNGKFVYVSNRGHNSIAVFKVGEDHKLTAAGHITGDIKIPRNFNIDPSGKWMLIASQDGHKVGVWEIDAKTGGAKETGSTVNVGSPVCVKFVAIEK
ncbi:MAG: lactonase family protein [Gemmataceae bacterium]